MEVLMYNNMKMDECKRRPQGCLSDFDTPKRDPNTKLNKRVVANGFWIIQKGYFKKMDLRLKMGKEALWRVSWPELTSAM